MTEPDVIYRLLNTKSGLFALGYAGLPYGTENARWAQFYVDSLGKDWEVNPWFPGADSDKRLYDAPVGTVEERAGTSFWPGDWVDVNPYLNWYNIRPGVRHCHTGADLNLNKPHFDADAHAPVYSIGDGEVYAVRQFSGWDWIICIIHEHCLTRYAHGEYLQVHQGQQVKRGDFLMKIGDAGGTYPYHLHFDITRLDARMLKYPGDWPGVNKDRVERDYLDPLKFLRGDYAK